MENLRSYLTFLDHKNIALFVTSLIQIIIGILMIAFGCSLRYHRDCELDATIYWFVGGFMIETTSILTVLALCGRSNSTDLTMYFVFITILCSIIVFLSGTTVVFVNYDNWTNRIWDGIAELKNKSFEQNLFNQYKENLHESGKYRTVQKPRSTEEATNIWDKNGIFVDDFNCIQYGFMFSFALLLTQSISIGALTTVSFCFWWSQYQANDFNSM